MVPDIAILFELDNKSKRLDYRKVPFNAWTELKQATSFTPKTLMQAIGDFDIDALVALLWLERKQRERRLQFGEVYQDLASANGDMPSLDVIDILTGGRSLIEPGTEQGREGGDGSENGS